MEPTPMRFFRASAGRALTWTLAVAFVMASLPSGAFAQDAASARARLQRLRGSRGGGTPTPAASATPGDGADYEHYTAPAGAADADSEEQIWQFNLGKDAPLDALLEIYSQVTGRTMIKAPGVNATFPNIKVQEKLNKHEMLQVMDTLLSMNKISLVPLGERFFRVVQIEQASTEGMGIQMDTPEGGFPESDALVSQLIRLKYLEMEDANTIVSAMLHSYGKVQRLDRINSLLVLETATNLRRIYDILEMVDQPTALNVETRIYVIEHAKATDIAARLNELVSDSGQKEEVAQVANLNLPVRRAPNMIRARQPAPAPVESASQEQAAAEKGIIQGKVKILTDERTNIIIVISNPLNFAFFNKIVEVLDRPVEAEVTVQVVSLEFADAEEMSSLLNEFIGAAKAEEEGTGRVAGNEGGTEAGGRARALEDFVRARASAADRVRQAAGDTAASKIGQLSPNTKILADKRTNTLLLMGTKGDIAALQEVIKKVDIMLAQVLIEAVILEVSLNNNTSYGVSWLQKSMTAYNARTVNGVQVKTPVASWGGSFGGTDFSKAAGDTISRAFAGGSGLNYFFTFTDLNMDALLSMVASSGEGRVLATPVILTTDNTEASIISGQSVPVRTGDSSYSSGTYYSDYEYKDVGIELKVKPRINPSRYVTLELTQTANTLGEPTDVGNGSTMYKINKRELTASISVPSRSTIALGGLVQTDYSSSESRVPILGSIPILGALFRNESKTRQRTELLVLITPYVLMTPEEAREETERLHRASNVAAEDWYRGWSDSSLAPFSPTKEREMKKAEKSKARDARLIAVDGVAPRAGAAAPVAIVAPAAPAEKPTPDAKSPEEFSREVERMMSAQAVMEAPDEELEGGESIVADPSADSPLPAPAEPAVTAPFTFDPAQRATPAEPPEPENPPAPSPAEVDGATPAPESEKPARRTLFGTRKVKVQDKKPSMFAAPETDDGENRGAP